MQDRYIRKALCRPSPDRGLFGRTVRVRCTAPQYAAFSSRRVHRFAVTFASYLRVHQVVLPTWCCDLGYRDSPIGTARESALTSAVCSMPVRTGAVAHLEFLLTESVPVGVGGGHRDDVHERRPTSPASSSRLLPGCPGRHPSSRPAARQDAVGPGRPSCPASLDGRIARTGGVEPALVSQHPSIPMGASRCAPVV